MKKLFLAAAALAAMTFAIPAGITPADAITLEQARAQCRAQLSNSGGRAREGGSTQFANCVRAKMQANKKK